MDIYSNLSTYRLEQAEQCLRSAKTLISVNDFMGAANRSYYCVFNAIKS